MTASLEFIDAFLQAHLDDYLQATIRLCAQPSVSATGEGVAACADLLAHMLQQHHFQVQVFPTAGQPVIVAHADGAGDRTLLLYNHYDVQPPEPLELWTTPPFTPTVRDGNLYARGVSDDKGEIIARLAALEAVRAAHGGRLPCSVTFIIEGEEETSSPHLEKFVHEHPALLAAQAVIWEGGGLESEGQAVVLLGVRGVLSVELSVKVMNRDAHSGLAHLLPNAAWRLAWALNSLKGHDERIRIPGFYDQVKPPSPRERDLLLALPPRSELYRRTLDVKAFVRGPSGAALNVTVFEPTCTIEGLTSGYQGAGGKTVIPAQASAKLDFRLVPDQTPADILAKLRAHLDAQGFPDVEIDYQGSSPPAKTSADDAFVDMVARTGTEVFGRPSLIDPMVGGSGPMHLFVEALGPVPIVFAGIGYWNNRAHAPDEHIRLQDFANGARHLARIVENFAGQV
jgi:acetylornithine deacetylase/succinyl-diaminopimelate desuccinylase-like protein